MPTDFPVTGTSLSTAVIGDRFIYTGTTQTIYATVDTIVPMVPPPPPPSGGLTAPLDTAEAIFRPIAPGNVPNEGTLTGVDMILAPDGPVFLPDAVLGDSLHYRRTSADRADIALPVALLNGSVTFAIRYRPTDAWTWRSLLTIMDGPLASPLKHFMLGCDTGNKYLSRFWDTTANRSQIPAQGTVSSNSNRTDTVVVTWDATTKTHALWVNGVKESSVVWAHGRTQATTSPLMVPHETTSLRAAGKVFSLAVFGRVLSDAEIIGLQTNPDWN